MRCDICGRTGEEHIYDVITYHMCRLTQEIVIERLSGRCMTYLDYNLLLGIDLFNVIKEEKENEEIPKD